MFRASLLLALVFGLAGCGGSDSGALTGEYIGQPGSWVDKLVFGPGNEVRAVDGEETALGIYSVDGKQVLVAISGDQSTLIITDNGCLDGGGMAGVYCKR